MAASAESLAITNTYRARLLALRSYAAGVSADQWRNIDPENLDESFGRYQRATSAAVGGVKRQGVSTAAAYVAAYVGAELGRRISLAGLDPEAYLATVDGRSLDLALLPPLFTVKAAIKGGRGIETALALGRARANRIVAVEAFDAPRRAQADLMRDDPRVNGWHRVVSANACGACLALANGELQAPEEDLKAHWHCRCLAEPDVKGARHTLRRPTGREVFNALSPGEQDALFRGRGGAEKADLIRSGAVPLEALVQRDPMAVVPDQYTEAPLSELQTGDASESHPET